MSRKIYSITVGGDERIRFSADLAEASAAVELLDLGGDLDTGSLTLFQTADGGHSALGVAYCLVRWSDLIECIGDDEEWDVEEVTNG